MKKYVVGSRKWKEQVRLEYEKPKPACYKYHTPSPSGYLNRLNRMERKHKQGYKQRKCIHCGLRAIWYKL